MTVLDFGSDWLPPEATPINCPRTGCGTVTEVSRLGRLRTHKLQDGWRTCAASGQTPVRAGEMDPPEDYNPGIG